MISSARRIAAILSLMLLSSVLVFAQGSPMGWTPEVMIKFKRVGGTAVSPDGKWIAYTVSTPLLDGEKSEFLTHIWVASDDGKTNMQYTRGDKSCSNPAFSPDGKSIAFLSSRGASGKNQVWCMELSGGEAEEITDAKSGVGSFRWAPDSRRIAYTMSDPVTEKEEKAKKEKRDMIVEDTNIKFSHLYTVALRLNAKGKRDVHRLTSGAFDVTTFDWSPDASTIVFAHQATPSADDWLTADISSVSSDSGMVKSLIKSKGADDSPVYSPDGKWIAYASTHGDMSWASVQDLYIIPAGGGEPKKMAETPDRDFGIIAWSSDSKFVFLNETDHTVGRVFAVPIDGGSVAAITTGDGTYSGVSVSTNGSAMAFIHQKFEVAPEVFVMSLKNRESTQLTNIHVDFPKLPMGRTEVIQWKSKDGRLIEGLLTYPVDYVKGQKYPLILNIHGGPTGVFTQSFTAAGSVYPLQAFAQQGYAILRPNPRGSGGYGAEFRRANIDDWGFGDYDDDQTGVDKVIAMGIAHPDSLVVCGWSYGGFMTSFTVTRTKRFKAASVGAGVTDLVSFTGTADIPSFLPSYFKGEYWDRMQTYVKHSAIFNIKGVTTPTQVIHGQSDVRVPTSQGYEFYRALQRQGCKTEMIVYPRTPHGPREPKFIQDIGERMLAWFNKNLGRNKSTE
jgi:dipeptidyl aminopeptidase/acylaminoacyl peptidase